MNTQSFALTSKTWLATGFVAPCVVEIVSGADSVYVALSESSAAAAIYLAPRLAAALGF